LRTEGLSEKEIEKIKARKHNFKVNQIIKDEILKIISTFGLITVDPNFENLIGITEKGSYKTYRAFNYVKTLTKDSIPDELENLIIFLLDFKIDKGRTTLKELKLKNKGGKTSPKVNHTSKKELKGIKKNQIH